MSRQSRLSGARQPPGTRRTVMMAFVRQSTQSASLMEERLDLDRFRENDTEVSRRRPTVYTSIYVNCMSMDKHRFWPE